MELKKIILGIIKLIVFLAAIFGGLIFVDWMFTPDWLTDTVAFAALGVGFILFVIVSIFRSKSQRNNNNKYKTAYPQHMDIDIRGRIKLGKIEFIKN